MQVQLPIEILIQIFRYQTDWFFFPKQNKMVHVVRLNKVLQHKCEQKFENNELKIWLPIKEGTEKCYSIIYYFHKIKKRVSGQRKRILGLHRVYVLLFNTLINRASACKTYASRYLYKWIKLN